MSQLRAGPRGCFNRCWEWREALLAGALGLWLVGFWAGDGWHHRRALALVLPFLLLGADRVAGTIWEVRWLWAVGLLLGWQTLSRSWADPPLVEVGRPGDAAVLFLLAAAFVAVGRRKDFGIWIIGGLAVLGACLVVFLLGAFYGDPAQALASDRFRNVLIYREFGGLNPVLTGMLCASGAVAAAWFTVRSRGWPSRIPWALALAVLVFGMLASQSRGAMLGFAAGVGALLFFEWRSCRSAVIAIGGAGGFYFLALLRSQQGADAAGGLLERGSSGRFAIYQWFLERLSGLEFVVGWGFGTNGEIPAEELGWLVHHPHSSYLTQFVLGGLIGLVLLLIVLGWSVREAWKEGRRGQSLWAALLACGLGSLLFDGAELFTLHSVPRLELLLVVVPACLLAGQAFGPQAGSGGGRATSGSGDGESVPEKV